MDLLDARHTCTTAAYKQWLRPPNVTDREVALRAQADKAGVLATLHQLGIHEALVPYSNHLADLSIDEMHLTVRSANGLKRANAGTFGRLWDLLAMENGILSVRNLGQKSAKEIKQVFYEECYTRLLPYEKAQYWQNVLAGQDPPTNAMQEECDI